MFNRVQETMRRINEKRHEGGFTLIELLIVIIILAILAAIVVFAVGTTSKNSVAASCSADAKSVETAIEAYKAQTGTYTTSIGALTTTNYFSAGVWTTTPGTGSSVGPWLRQEPGTSHYVIYLGGGGSGGTSGGIYALAPPASTGSFTSFTQAFDATAGTTQSNDNFDTNASLCGSFQ